MKTPTFEQARDELIAWARENKKIYHLTDEYLDTWSAMTQDGHRDGTNWKVSNRHAVFTSLIAAHTRGAECYSAVWAVRAKARAIKTFETII